ncbi:MAG: oligogalacturonide lyase [Prevotellaceae bacterium]|nr:oligogalacturonide lyase [Prevotellaceae bacterium]
MKTSINHLTSFLFVCMLCFAATANAQGYGVYGQSESWSFFDEGSGREMTILTDTTKNDRFLYQTDPMWTPDGQYLLFRSSSRGKNTNNTEKGKWPPTQLYFIEVATGRIIQATDGDNTGSGFLANKSNKMFLNRRVDEKWNLYVIDLDQFFADVHNNKVKKHEKYEKFIGTFPDDMGRPGGYCISSDDKWAYITVERNGTPEEIERMNKNAFLPESNQPVKIKPTLSGIRKMNLETGKVEKVCDVEFKVGHIQSSRFRPEEIVFCNETGGDAFQRMWYVKSDGTDLKPLYKETPLDWVTHETFASEDFVYFNVLGYQPRLRKQAHGIFRINLRNDDVDVLGQVETGTAEHPDRNMLGGMGFWHCNATRDNKWATGDTFAGNVWVINIMTGEKHLIATNCKMRPDHAQPFFSPDGTKLCFQTGRFSNGKRLNLVMVDLKSLQR